MPDRRGLRHPAALVAIAVAAVCVLVVSGFLLHRPGRAAPVPRSNGDPATVALGAGSAASSIETTTPASRATSASASASPSPSTGVTVRYAAPGGESIAASRGWIADASSGVTSIRDYVESPGTDRLVSPYVRIGTSNPHPLTSISLEAAGAVDFLRSQDSEVVIVGETFGQFLGADSGDIEFTNFHNSRGVARHALERLWITGGFTRILKWDTPTDQWDPALRVFHQLASTCVVS